MKPNGAKIDDEVIFTITKQDIIACAKDMGLPEQVITNIDILLVKKYVEWDLIVGQEW